MKILLLFEAKCHTNNWDGRIQSCVQYTVHGTASSSHGALFIISTVPDFSQIYLLHKNNATWLFIKVIFFILIYFLVSKWSFDIIKSRFLYKIQPTLGKPSLKKKKRWHLSFRVWPPTSPPLRWRTILYFFFYYYTIFGFILEKKYFLPLEKCKHL